MAVLATLTLIVLSGKAWEQEHSQMPDSVADDTLDIDEAAKSTDTVYVYYFHGDRRCATCRKLEEYSREAIESGFKEELTESTLVWRPTNYDKKDNEHFIKDYELFTKSLILSRARNGEEIDWKNLDKIWRLVGSKDKFIKYVQDEARDFLIGNYE